MTPTSPARHAPRRTDPTVPLGRLRLPIRRRSARCLLLLTSRLGRPAAPPQHAHRVTMPFVSTCLRVPLRGSRSGATLRLTRCLAPLGRRRRRLLLVLRLISAALLASLLVPLAPQATPVRPGLRILDRSGRLLYEVVDAQRGASSPVPLDDIAASLRLATIAVEDASFESNPGLEPLALARAAWSDLQAGRVVAGGSTITQQLARLRYLPDDERSQQSILRKLHEAWLAIHLTVSLGKQQVLEQYLNTAPYGNFAVGAEAAAGIIFGKPARELSLAEAAFLAGLPQAPADYDPFTHPAAARARQSIVLDRMVHQGFITPSAAEAARAEPLQLNPTPYPIQAPHFVELVRDALAATDPPPDGAIRTTLDLDLQTTVERAISHHLSTLDPVHDLTDAAVVVLDSRTGEILALAGSADYFDPQRDGQVNLAVAPRQPGSAFKPVVYAAAFETGRYSPATILDDVRTPFTTRHGELYVPENYDRRFHGRVPVRVALASSFNVPAVSTLADVGLPTVLSLAHDMGLTPLATNNPERYDLSLALGGGEVRLLDLTAAYATFADGGIYHAPRLLLAAPARLSDSLADPPNAVRRVVSPETAWLITDILADDAARAPGFGAHGVLELDRPAAVKTGTTSDFRDNWTVGYTPELTVGVWAGNADNHPMQDVSGVTGAAPLWHDVLTAALANLPPTSFPRPPDLVQVHLTTPYPHSEWLRSTDLARTPASPAYPSPRPNLSPAPPPDPASSSIQPSGSNVPRPGDLPTRPNDRSSDQSDSGSPAASGQPHPRLLSPDPDATFVVDPTIPTAVQHLLIEAEPPVEPGPNRAAAAAAAGRDPAGVREPALHPAVATEPRPDESATQPTHCDISQRPATGTAATPRTADSPAGPTAAGRVELFVDGQLLADLESPPYAAAWPLARGQHTAWAQAIGADGTRTLSPPHTFTVR